MQKFKCSEYRVGASCKPGEKGTIELSKKYGDDLIRIRYRYNRKLGIRIKTVELIVDVVKI